MPWGHIYKLIKKIPDPNAEIYVLCRTHHRIKYAAALLIRYGYKNVWLYEDGVVGWAKAGQPFVNQFTGKFVIADYRKIPSEQEMSFHFRQYHPY